MIPRIAIVGEAYGEEEARKGRPFVGGSGRILNWFLRQAGINRRECHVTNVFNLRPPSNQLDKLLGPKAESVPGFPPIRQGKYIKAEYAPELSRLEAELNAYSPTLILALGNTALVATTGLAGIKKMRGYPIWSERYNCKVLATYHPAAVMRQWSLNPIVHADMDKVVRESAFLEIRRPNRQIWIEPELKDLDVFYTNFILPNQREPLSVDIETQAGQITCIGFAPTHEVALVLPFVDWRAADCNYWPTLDEELQALRWARKVLESATRVVGQNFAYDIKYLYKYRIRVPGYTDDTMIHSHAQQPELEKSLNFLASVHTNEPSWKFMRTDIKTIKTED